MLPVTHPAEVALLELAADIGRPEFRDPSRIATMLRLHMAERESYTRQLEGTTDVLRRMRIPHLEGEVRSLTLDRDEWSARAKDAEARLHWGVAIIVVLGFVLVGTIGFLAMHGVA